MLDLMTYVRVALVVVAMAAGLGGAGCRRSSSCPAGLEELRVGTDSLWCKDQQTGARLYVQMHPGTKRWRQKCAFTKAGLDGPFEATHPGGQKWIEGRYEAGRLAGKWTQWDEAGNKVADGEYRDGHLVAGAPVAVAAVCDKVPHVE
jgi:hypothetical protein